ncbi:hypothetical protein LDENG_00255280, partial [Lucifuga dentata]
NAAAGRSPSFRPVPVSCALNLQALFILLRVREADTDTVSDPTTQRSVMFTDVTPVKLSADQMCSKMLTNTSTADELVSKKGNVSSSFGSCSVLRFMARSSYKRYRPICCSFKACSKRVCRWNTVTYMLHVIL